MTNQVIKQRQLKDNWIEVVEGEMRIDSLDRRCRLWVRRGGQGEPFLVTLPVVIKPGDTYKVIVDTVEGG